MAERTILLDPTEEVFGKNLDQIADGTVEVWSAADFPIGEKYPAGTVDKLIADYLEFSDGVCGRSLPYPRTKVDKNRKPRRVGDHPALRRIFR